MTVRDPIFGSGPKAERAARLKRKYGETLGLLAALNCLTEEEASVLWFTGRGESVDEVLSRAELEAAGVSLTKEDLDVAAQLGVSREALMKQKAKDNKASGRKMTHAERRAQLQADLAKNGLTLTDAQADEALAGG